MTNSSFTVSYSGFRRKRSWGRGYIFYYQRKCEWARGEESTEGARWKVRMCFLADVTKFAECCQIHGNKPPRSWINCLATNLSDEGRNTHWLDPNSGCSDFHPLRSCISGDACVDTCRLLVLLEKFTRKARAEVEVLWGGCFWEASQSSCRAGCHRSSWTGAEDSWSLEHLRDSCYVSSGHGSPLLRIVGPRKSIDAKA